MYTPGVNLWFLFLFYYNNFKPHRTKDRRENITPSQQEIDFIMVLARSEVFLPHCKTIWDNSNENVLRHYGNQQSGCRDTSLHKAAAQPEHSISEGKSFNKLFPHLLRGTQGDGEICSYRPTQPSFMSRGMNDTHWGIQVEICWGGIFTLIHLHRRRRWHILNLQGFL